VSQHFEGGTSKCWDEDEWARGGYAWFKPGQVFSLLPAHDRRAERWTPWSRRASSRRSNCATSFAPTRRASSDSIPARAPTADPPAFRRLPWHREVRAHHARTDQRTRRSSRLPRTGRVAGTAPAAR
jgi:hypothetical protein